MFSCPRQVGVIFTVLSFSVRASVTRQSCFHVPSVGSCVRPSCMTHRVASHIMYGPYVRVSQASTSCTSLFHSCVCSTCCEVFTISYAGGNLLYTALTLWPCVSQASLFSSLQDACRLHALPRSFTHFCIPDARQAHQILLPIRACVR